MENAIKAIYMSVGMLIAILVVGVWVYMFRSAGKLSESYEFKKSTEQVQAFNSQFETYAGITKQADDSDKGYSFAQKSNIASDVISCANLVFDINSKNDYDLQNTITVKVKISGALSYYLTPYKIHKKNKFIKETGSFSLLNVKNLNEAGQEIPEEHYYDFNEFLRYYNNVRIVNIESPEYKSSFETVYQYYFDVDEEGIEYSETTGKVEAITFELYTTKHFNDTTYWKDSE